jgi:hypothetical protein
MSTIEGERIKIACISHIYRIILRKWEFKQKIPRKAHVNTASVEEKEAFKKDRTDTCCG